jgi:hypothetical protein
MTYFIWVSNCECYPQIIYHDQSVITIKGTGFNPAEDTEVEYATQVARTVYMGSAGPNLWEPFKDTHVNRGEVGIGILIEIMPQGQQSLYQHEDFVISHDSFGSLLQLLPGRK